MKILHTADWHVGKTIRGRSRADEHAAVLTEIADVAAREQVDLVIVAGDQFDTAAPSARAEAIVYRALLDLAATGAQVVVLAGNHDSSRRWDAVKPVLDHTNVHAAARLARPADGGVVDVPVASGQTARIALLPWVSQRSIVRADQLMELDADQHAGRYAERMRQIVEALTADFGPETVNIVAGHLTVAGGMPTLGGGERAAHTIFDYVVPPAVFPADAHYVALGHLHLPHRIPGPCPIWYAGSPLALDFGERETDHKAVLIAEADPGIPAEVRPVALQAGRRLRTLRGSLDEVLDRAGQVGDAHLRVILDEPARSGLADQVRRELPGVVDVSIAPPEDGPDDPDWDLDSLRGSPVDLFADYLEDRGVEDEELEALFRELLEEVHAPDAP